MKLKTITEQEFRAIVAQHKLWLGDMDVGKRADFSCAQSEQEFRAIVAQHQTWLDDNDTGKKADFSLTDLRRFNLQGLDLRYANFYGSDLEGTNLKGTNFEGADLERANLERAKLEEADLSCAYLMRANLPRTNLKSANLRRAKLEGANLEGADFGGTRISEARGNNKEIKSLRVDGYKVAYTKSELAIGCEQHPIVDWWGFSDEVIADMDTGALDWWEANKDKIKRQIENSPAK